MLRNYRYSLKEDDYKPIEVTYRCGNFTKKILFPTYQLKLFFPERFNGFTKDVWVFDFGIDIFDINCERFSISIVNIIQLYELYIEHIGITMGNNIDNLIDNLFCTFKFFDAYFDIFKFDDFEKIAFIHPNKKKCIYNQK